VKDKNRQFSAGELLRQSFRQVEQFTSRFQFRHGIQFKKGRASTVFLWFIFCRFREFVELRRQLLAEYSEYPLPLPSMPPKTMLASTDPVLLQQRRVLYVAVVLRAVLLHHIWRRLDELLLALCCSRGLLSSKITQRWVEGMNALWLLTTWHLLSL
jgi:hypothetical protein